MGTVSSIVGATTAAQTRDEALEIAVREHARLVFRIAYSVLRNHHDAEDATQETFFRVMRYGGKISRVTDVRSWLARIAWRVAIERHKKRQPATDAAHEIDLLRSTASGADDILVQAEAANALEKVIASLPEKLRGPLVLSTIEEMSSAEIAKMLEIDEAAVRSRVFRARQIVIERLAALLEINHAK